MTSPEPLPIDPFPTDSDVDLHVRRQRRELRRHPVAILAVISIGGGLGALARWGVSLALPATTSGFPWATFAVNGLGCLLIGVLMVLVTDVWPGQVLIRPFFGVGVLGGFTTFSTYVVDIQRLVDAGAVTVALAYLFGTLLTALIAVTVGMSLTLAALRRFARGAGAALAPDGEGV